MYSCAYFDIFCTLGFSIAVPIHVFLFCFCFFSNTKIEYQFTELDHQIEEETKNMTLTEFLTNLATNSKHFEQLKSENKQNDQQEPLVIDRD